MKLTPLGPPDLILKYSEILTSWRNLFDILSNDESTDTCSILQKGFDKTLFIQNAQHLGTCDQLDDIFTFISEVLV